MYQLTGNPLEHMDIVPAIMPVDLSTGANAGDWISLKNYDGVLIVIASSIGTAGDDPVFSLDQATAVAGTGAKALSSIDTIYHKTGATAISGVSQFTIVSQTASDSYDTDPIAGAENEALYVINVRAEDLDVDGGFDCVQLTVADVGTNAQLGAAFYLLYGAKHARQIPLASITD